MNAMKPENTASGPSAREPITLMPWEKGNYVDLQWIPLAVRFKLDKVGLKIGLKAWQALPFESRQDLLKTPFAASHQQHAWSEALRQAMTTHGLGEPTPFPQAPPLSDTREALSPEALLAWRSVGFDLAAGLGQLSDFGRYVAIKTVQSGKSATQSLTPDSREHWVEVAHTLGLPAYFTT